MRPACRTERRGSRSHAIYGGRTGRRRQGRAAGNPLGQDRRILDHLEKLGAFTPNRSGFPIVEVPLADPDDLARAGRFLLDRLADVIPLRRI
jgi:hypothetical protein